MDPKYVEEKKDEVAQEVRCCKPAGTAGCSAGTAGCSEALEDICSQSDQAHGGFHQWQVANLSAVPQASTLNLLGV